MALSLDPPIFFSPRNLQNSYGVSKMFGSVCLFVMSVCFVCPEQLKTNDPKVFNIGIGNVGAGNPPTTLFLDEAPVEGVEEFIYLGSKQSSSGYCRPDMLRRVGFASSVMSSLQRIWKCSYLSV